MTASMSDVYHLLPMCHVHTNVRIKFLSLGCLLPYFLKLPHTYCFLKMFKTSDKHNILCEILGFHSGVVEVSSLLGCDAVYSHIQEDKFSTTYCLLATVDANIPGNDN